jgi:BirA family biotin operon repressor/biotin-[acetyl-CoA-carboxylase] ligase
MEHSFQPTILRFDSVDSTNLEAMRQAKSGAPEGLCIVAREQTRGRGRLDRSWQSPKDAGLYFSMILRPQLEMSSWPLITLTAALAVCDALLKACELRADIKWPNDICHNERKLCGILVETIDAESSAAAIVGVGINLTADSLPRELLASATSVDEVVGCAPDRELVLQELVRAITERYDFLCSPQGAEHTIREWCANSSYAFDRRVGVTLLHDRFEGTTRGLERDGALRVETNDGKMRIVRAGDVTALRPTD